MSGYRQVFPVRHSFFAVVHVENEKQALRNAGIAFGPGGADGIFLINHSIDVPQLFEIYKKVRRAFPDRWIGLNYLGLGHNVHAFNYVDNGVDGFWFDGAGLQERLAQLPTLARVLYHARKRRHRQKCLLFFGVAFKGQRQPADPSLEAMQVAPYVDAVVTSGPETGSRPSLEKIQSIRPGTGFPLLIASGMTPESVTPYLPYCDGFMVATGISSSFTELDPVRVHAFHQARLG